ncbi:MAG: TetR/AcrR family transcriptional regulator [Bacteroidales bacterium]|jgi:AcrR family transcriptional regulator
MNITTTEISDQTALLFRDFGMKSITMDDVSSAMGISKKTLYRFVSNKEDLIRLVFRNELRKRVSEIQSVLKKEYNAIEQLIEIQKLIVDFLKKYSCIVEYDLKKYYPGIFREVKKKYITLLENLFIMNIRKGKQEELYRNDLNEHIISKLHTSRILNIPQSTIISIEDFTSDKYVHEMIQYHLRAMLNDKSISILEKYKHELA